MTLHDESNYSVLSHRVEELLGSSRPYQAAPYLLPKESPDQLILCSSLGSLA